MVLGLAVLGVGARTPALATHVTVTVVNPQGEPIPNAGVVLDQLSDLRGKKVKHGLNVELKSNRHGKADLGDFVEGRILIQVIASGYETFGKVYLVRTPNYNVTVHLHAPRGQMSIY